MALEFTSDLKWRTNPKVYPPVNRCIYCGDTNTKGLTREHIIPFGLEGSLILPKASCTSCAAITRDIETACLRGNFLGYRIRNNLPTRNPKERPDKDTVEHCFVMPVFATPPGILTGKAFSENVRVKLRRFDALKEGDVAGRTRHVAAAPDLTKVAPGEFVRMLAKVAHGFAAAELGAGSFEPYLLPLIRGDGYAEVSQLMGSADGWVISCPPDLIHQIHWRFSPVGRDLLVGVRIVLLARHGTPPYFVVAGKLIQTPETLARFKLVMTDPGGPPVYRL